MGAGVRQASGRVVRRVLGVGALVGGLVLAGLGGLGGPEVAAASTAPAQRLYLVTLEGPGTAGDTSATARPVLRERMRREQDAVLATVGAPEPVYRWSTALNGVAVRLDAARAERLRTTPGVTLVEPDAVRPLAGLPRTASAPGDLADPAAVVGSGRRTGGAGVVIGLVDSGIHPDSPLFARVPGLGRAPAGFDGVCEVGQDWSADTCTGKLAGARWFVEGFGRDRVRATSSLSPDDDDGHGTQLASIAAGNAGVSVRVRGQRLGTYAGQAPQARIAAYKACWSAPDPHDDGCATADLVTAVDRATSDGVDVLNLSVAGGRPGDTLERALLGAAEADVVVVAAGGNDRDRAVSHTSPWVTTVGGLAGVVRRGRAELSAGGSAGPSLVGAMASTRGVEAAGIVLGGQVGAEGRRRAAARRCTPGSLDASRVSGRVVVCERGGIGRVDKSEAVRQADGVGMVLLNVRPGSTDPDFHRVPTVHLTEREGRVLRRWVVRHPGARVKMRPLGVERAAPAVVGWSSSGRARGSVVKPDVVAPATGAVGAVPPSPGGARWDVVDGTSAAAAWTSGVAALLRARHDWPAATVRSALATSAAPVSGPPSVLRSGSGRVHASAARDPGLVLTVAPGDYRRWSEGRLTSLNTPSILQRVPPGATRSVTRTVTNVQARALYFSSAARGFARHRVQVTPAAVRLSPGESATFRVRISPRPGRGGARVDDGFVVWRGARGSVTRIPVVLHP